jgi:hypothetical protein
MDRDSSQDEGSGEGIVDRIKEAAGNLTGGNAGSAEVDNRMQADAVAGSGRADPVSDTLSSGSIDSTDSGAFDGGSGVDYASEMGGGAPDTDLAGGYNERAGVRSAYDRTTDEPGSYSEGERDNDDETLT